MTSRSRTIASVGVVETGNSVVLVTITARGHVLDRRRVDLTHDLPTHPHHHQGSWAVGRYLSTPGATPMSLAEAVRLVERVRAAAEQGAREILAVLAATVTVPIASIALRVCPELPPTIEERIKDNRAQTIADTVMYRQALAGAAEARGWFVHWYDRDNMRCRNDLAVRVATIGKLLGPPWQAAHKLAAVAALSALRTPSSHAR